MSSTRTRSICPISCALDLLGDKWSLLVIRDMAFLHKKYFKDFLNSSEGIATNILTERLKRLENDDIIQKQPDPNNGRQVIYTLTEKGIALIPTLTELILWGALYAKDADVKDRFIKRIKNDRQAFIEEITQKYRSFKDAM